MGQWDCFCAICGVLAGAPRWTANYPDFVPDEDIVTNGYTDWMGDIRIIGENLGSDSAHKAFITGTARASDYGEYDILQLGSDPLVPHVTALTVYNLDVEEGLSFPFHAACFELFKKFHLPNLIDNDAFYRAIKSLVPYEGMVTLDIEYGPVGDNQDQFWEPRHGDEAYITLPTTIPSLAEYYEKLPSLSHVVETTKVGLPVRQQNSSVLDALSPELIYLIIEYLDMSCVNSLRAASGYVAQLPLNSAFWRKRINRDQPWLYDLPEDQDSNSVDWAQTYKDLLRRSEESFDGHIRGLVNRRRIWDLCDQISETYLETKE